MAEDDEALTCDRIFGNAVSLLQPKRGHRVGTDAVLLAALAAVAPPDRVVDLGSASGAVGLMIAHREPGARVTFVEREPDLVALCRRNIALNGLQDRAAAIEADIFAPAAERRETGLTSGQADLVVTNPPFLDETARPSPDAGRRTAHAMRGGDLRAWLACADDLLAMGGRLFMIHRADRLDACLSALAGPFGSAEVRPVYPRDGAPATRILVAAVKGGRAPLRLQPPLVLHEADGQFTAAAAALHRSRT